MQVLSSTGSVTSVTHITVTHLPCRTCCCCRTKQKEVLEAVTAQAEELQRKVDEQELQVGFGWVSLGTSGYGLDSQEGQTSWG